MHRYQEVARLIQGWIESGTLRPGDRVQSVRETSVQTGFSMVTVHRAYALLENEGVLTARPRSGFFVADRGGRRESFAHSAIDFHDDEAHAMPVRLQSLLATWRERKMPVFGGMSPSDDLLPSKEMKAQILHAFRSEITRQESPSLAGEMELRESVAKRAIARGLHARADDIVIASNTQAALGLCLDAVTRAGGSVLVERPFYFPLYAALKRRQLKVIEIDSDPQLGVDPDRFEALLDDNDIQACVLTPTNHFPTGVTYSNDVLERVVAKASAKRVPIIELDIFGELSFGAKLPGSLKSFDHDDIVLQIGSFAATLGPAFAFGWIINRNFQRTLLRSLVFNDSSAGEAALQGAIAEYLHHRSFDRHLRKVRAALEDRMRTNSRLIAAHLPAGAEFSEPAGGFMCWVELPGAFDALRLSQRALEAGVSLPPGPLFSMTHTFENCLGLNFSYPPEQVAQAMATFDELFAMEG